MDHSRSKQGKLHHNFDRWATESQQSRTMQPKLYWNPRRSCILIIFVCFCGADLINSMFFLIFTKIQVLFMKIHAWANIVILIKFQNLELPLPQVECLSDGLLSMIWVKPFLSNINSQVDYLHVWKFKQIFIYICLWLCVLLYLKYCISQYMK